MNAGLLSLSFPIVMAGVPTAILTYSAFRVRREARAPGATAALILMVLSALWLAANVGRVTTPGQSLATLFENIAATALVLLPAVFVVFAAQYSCDRTFLRLRALALLAIEPILALGFLWIKGGIYGTIDRPWLASEFGITNGPHSINTFWVMQTSYSYLMLALGTYVLVRTLIRARQVYGMQALMLVVVAILPASAAILMWLGLDDFPTLEVTYLLASLVSWALVHRLYSLRSGRNISVSQTVVTQKLEDAVLLLDAENCVRDANPAAQRILDQEGEAKLTQLLQQMGLGGGSEAPFRRKGGIGGTISREVVLGAGDDQKVFDISTSAISDWHGMRVGRLIVLHDITDRKRLEQELSDRFEGAKYLGERDSLTGLLNHAALHRHLDEELARSERYGLPLSLLMMDLDGFKLLNDTYGHPEADKVLKKVTRMLSAECRDNDILARYGGDEFAAILPETDWEGALALTQRFRSALAASPYMTPTGLAVPVRISIGIATYPFEASTARELIASADANLYDAKQQDAEGLIASPDFLPVEVSKDSTYSVLEGLVTTVHRKDRYTRRHSLDVTDYALAIARKIGLPSDQQQALRIAANLHDVGKIGVPDAILRKPGSLDDAEYEIIKRHATLGELIIKDVPNLDDVVAAVGTHHERLDGSGYPHGLKGSEIPLLGRILAVADTYSALTSDRPYRAAKSVNEARFELLRVAGTQLDPDLVNVFVNFCLTEDGLVPDVFESEGTISGLVSLQEDELLQQVI